MRSGGLAGGPSSSATRTWRRSTRRPRWGVAARRHRADLIAIPPGERSKDLRTAGALYGHLAALAADRRRA